MKAEAEKPVYVNGVLLGTVAVTGTVCVHEHDEDALCWAAIAYLVAGRKYDDGSKKLGVET